MKEKITDIIASIIIALMFIGIVLAIFAEAFGDYWWLALLISIGCMIPAPVAIFLEVYFG